MCLDKGYDFDEVRRTLDEFGFTAHIRSRGEEAKAIKREAGFKARRWVVERSHSWLNRFRRILVRWDKSPDNYIAFLHFACALTALRACWIIRIGSKTRCHVRHGEYLCGSVHPRRWRPVGVPQVQEDTSITTRHATRNAESPPE